MKPKTLLGIVVVATVVGNAVAYMVVKGRGGNAPEPEVSVAAPAVVSAEGAGAAGDEGREPAGNALVRAHRAAGLAALEDGDPTTAESEFLKALKLSGAEGSGDVTELLRIATSMRERMEARAAAQRPAARDEAEARQDRSGTTSRRRAGTQTSAPTTREPRSGGDGSTGDGSEAHTGLLLVTSTPSGLLVKVNGRKIDLTPARVRLPVGAHEVSLMRGEVQVLSQTAYVRRDEVTSVDADLAGLLAMTREGGASPATTPAPAPAPGVSRDAEPSLPGETQENRSPVRPLGAVAPAPEPAPSPGPVPAVARGELYIPSSTLYGEIWVANRPYGFPPVTVRDLPPGPTIVELRVQGETRRRLSVEVVPARRTVLRVK